MITKPSGVAKVRKPNGDYYIFRDPRDPIPVSKDIAGISLIGDLGPYVAKLPPIPKPVASRKPPTSPKRTWWLPPQPDWGKL
jgi:hypothetical protein